MKFNNYPSAAILGACIGFVFAVLQKDCRRPYQAVIPAAKPERKNSRLWKIRQVFKFWQPFIVCVTTLLLFLVKLILTIYRGLQS